MKHRNFPGVALCVHSRDRITQHLDVDTIEVLRAKKGGEIMANHALLMSSQTPNIPKLEDVEPRWFTDSVPRAFTGTAYTDGSASTYHAFKKARRAGWAAVVIAEELPIHSDVQSGNSTSQDNSDKSEAEADDSPQPQLAQIQHTHPQNKWPVQLGKASGSIIKVYDNRLTAEGVGKGWRILSINGENVYDNPNAAIQRHIRSASITREVGVVITVISSPQRVVIEDNERRKCSCPNITNLWHVCCMMCADSYGRQGLCKRKKRKSVLKDREPPPRIVQAIWGPLKG